MRARYQKKKRMARWLTKLVFSGISSSRKKEGGMKITDVTVFELDAEMDHHRFQVHEYDLNRRVGSEGSREREYVRSVHPIHIEQGNVCGYRLSNGQEECIAPLDSVHVDGRRMMYWTTDREKIQLAKAMCEAFFRKNG